MAANPHRRRIEQMFAGEHALFPYAKRLGLTFVKLEEGHTWIEMPVDDTLGNSAGTVHGGALFSLLDTCMGTAATSTLEGTGAALLVEASVSFLRVPKGKKLLGEGVVVRRGRSVIHLEATIKDAQGELVAKAMGAALVVQEPVKSKT